MMHFAAIDVPASTPESDPVIQRVNTRAGVVRYVAVFFPAGTQDAVKVRLTDSFQSFGPSGGWITGDDMKVDWPERYRVQGPPYELNVFAFNESTTAPYTIKVMVVVE